jgi:hypothetical protein
VLPDMTLCANICPLSQECLRHATGKRIERIGQSFGFFEPAQGRECYGYIPPRGAEVVACE